ncbi:pilus assembly protein [Teredinibacter haidensis]|uniref:pilus assembly protein n=1 Tax=Teredinibacter haidensis TaxID=2731755 RepID=UPI000948FDAD|nr:PilC/PilY family type IV pilus protein [Teredinibacter haidensis]
MKKRIVKCSLGVVLGFVSAFLSLAVVQVSAGPLLLSRDPLFVGSNIQPNVLFLIDDSRSMYFQVSMTKGAKALSDWFKIYGPYYTGFNEYGGNGDSMAQDFEIAIVPGNIEQYLELCPGYNALAYNPNVTYTPWETMPNASYPFAAKNPGDSAAGDMDLSSAKYVEWNDSIYTGTIGDYDFGECGVYFSGYGSGYTYDSSKLISAENTQNYANWYTYHRSRDFLFKRALSNIFKGLQTRAGLATINANADLGWGVEMEDVDNLTYPAGVQNENKDKLMTALFKISSSDSTRYTPLRRALENAGRYYLADYTNFPVQEGFVTGAGQPADPILSAAAGGSCQQNHTILATDGYRAEYGAKGNKPRGLLNDDAKIPWYGNMDQNSVNVFDGGLYEDTVSDTLADIAMYFYKTDLRPLMDAKVKVRNPEGDLNPDENEQQHMVTHTLSFGVYGNLTAPPPWSDVGEVWPTSIFDDTPETLDDLIHAAFNGRGEYLSASNITSLESSLDAVMKSIANMAGGTGAAVGFNSTSISSGSMLYQGKFSNSPWTGDLFAYDFTSGKITEGSEKWEAGRALDARVSARKIVTYNGYKGTAFKAPGDYMSLAPSTGGLNSYQVNDLLKGGVVDSDKKQAYIEDIVEYLRAEGDGSNKFPLGSFPDFRVRTTLLGDIVHSSPQYVGVPSADYAANIESTPYSVFVDENKDREPILYVGANDGMLHGFLASSGEEVFAYIPQAVFSSKPKEGLHWLADTDYSHMPYVDSTPSTADVFVDGSWKTYLAGGLGAGGKAVYVLDITDPAAILSEDSLASKVVVTEFADKYLGYTFSRPRIGKLNDGEWVAIFGNGYNNAADGEAYLYVLYLDGSGPGGATHKKIGPLGGGALGSVAGGDCAAAGSDCNGLSSPSLLDLDGNSTIDRVYAGDLQGNMWAFDFFSGDIKTISPTVPVVAHQNLGKDVPLFSACRGSKPGAGYCSDGDRQPITSKPVVVAHPAKSAAGTDPNLIVIFGTGRFLSTADLSDTNTQSFYGVWDAGEMNGELRPGHLTEQAISDASSGAGRELSTNSVGYTVGGLLKVGANFGWHINFPVRKERVVIDPTVAGTLATFVTTIPTEGDCERQGDGYLMAVDLLSGGQPLFHVFPDNKPDLSGVAVGALPGGMVLLDDNIIISDSAAKITQVKANYDHPRPNRRSAWSIVK